MSRSRRITSWCVAALFCACTLVTYAEAAEYIAKDSVDLFVLLAPPPGPNDPRTTTDLNELRRIQATRSPERVVVAQADDKETVFRFLVVFDRPLTSEQLPKTAAFFRKLTSEGSAPISAAKVAFGRPRPYAVAKDLERVCPPDTFANRSYPSGHTSVGYLMGVVLAAMVPEKKEAIFARAQEYGESRMVCGVHYPTDVEAGRIAGTVLAAAAMKTPEFQRDFAAARTELRSALGL